MNVRTKHLSRRNFLLTAGAGGAAAAAAIVAKKPLSAQSPDASRRASRGYQATTHISNYYRTTKV